MRALPRYLSQTERLFDEIRRELLRRYDLWKEAAYIDELRSDIAAADIKWQELIRPSLEQPNMGPEAEYFQELLEVIGPPLEVASIYKKLRPLSPRNDGLRRHRSLESLVMAVAHESYRFKERLKALSRTLNGEEDVQRLGRAIRNYSAQCKEIITVRNSFVHGRKTACKELGRLDGLEILAITMHDDIWLEYRNAFEEARLKWRSQTRRLLESMEAAMLQVNIVHSHMRFPSSITAAAQ